VVCAWGAQALAGEPKPGFRAARGAPARGAARTGKEQARRVGEGKAQATGAVREKGDEGMAFKFTKVVDITFIAKDAEKTAEFYKRVGLRRLPVAKPKVFALGDKELAIHPELGADDPVENPNTVYVSVLVDDLGALCKHLDGQGISYVAPRDSHLGQKSIHLTDPDGNHLEIHQASP
jgi:catechol 2,3-dioxygenase-like lactoylglutathione lyase family enzyme